MSGVLLFNGCYSPPFDEGVKLVVRRLAEALARAGPVTVATTARGASEEVVVVPPGPWGFWRAMRNLVQATQPDAIVYVPDAYLDRYTLARCGLLRLAAGRMPIAMVTLQPNTFDLPVRLMLRLWRPDVVFAQADAPAGLYERYGIRWQVLPPAVDAETFRPAAGPDEKRRLRRQYGLLTEGKVCLHVGHIRENRNMAWLVRLSLPADARLVVVGSTSRAIETHLVDRLRERGATVIERFLPHVEEVYRLADVYLFPVEQGTAAIEMPLSVLEAMACNLPVVSTPFGGLVRCFEGVPGVYFAATEEAFGDAVRRALDVPVPETRKAVENHTWNRIAADILNCMETCGCH